MWVYYLRFSSIRFSHQVNLLVDASVDDGYHLQVHSFRSMMRTAGVLAGYAFLYWSFTCFQFTTKYLRIWACWGTMLLMIKPKQGLRPIKGEDKVSIWQTIYEIVVITKSVKGLFFVGVCNLWVVQWLSTLLGKLTVHFSFYGNF